MIHTNTKILLIMFMSVLSCKNTSHNARKNFIENTQSSVLLTGDSLISDKHFIEKIDSTCLITNGYYGRTDAEIKNYKKKCAYYEIKFSYEELNPIENKVIQNFGDIDYIINSSSKASDADDFTIKNLILKKNNVITDSIRVYSYENYIEALAQKNEYFYLKDNYLWVLKFNEDEDGINVENWSKYKIDNMGKIVSLE
ncbi:hypothetical protein A8C32_03680 [Flavivirga aquatica]|uniref:Lipoprotein n=1 Tax=Flavivirga aquatica TaxID=1849968 RepID=A0A1E5TB26_9FLAO|nr:hypothetical protein [Flavivirga aquatica]OEK08561.1 hypothetical protein A8C32_03680 [Flavivirga aquatica]